MKKHIVLLLLAICCSSAFAYDSTLYPAPTYWAPKDLAQWSQPLIKTYAADPDASDALPGDIVIVSNGTTFSVLRCNADSSAWETLVADVALSSRVDDLEGMIATITSGINDRFTIASAANKANLNGSSTQDFYGKDLIAVNGVYADDLVGVPGLIFMQKPGCLAIPVHNGAGVALWKGCVVEIKSGGGATDTVTYCGLPSEMACGVIIDEIPAGDDGWMAVAGMVNVSVGADTHAYSGDLLITSASENGKVSTATVPLDADEHRRIIGQAMRDEIDYGVISGSNSGYVLTVLQFR